MKIKKKNKPTNKKQEKMKNDDLIVDWIKPLKIVKPLDLHAKSLPSDKDSNINSIKDVKSSEM